MAAKKYYAVAVGRQPGIYDNWPAAQAQVSGFPGARFKGFPSRGAAEAWLHMPTFGQAPGNIGSKPRPAPSPPALREDGVTIYTDGGALNNPGPGGYGIVKICNGTRIERSGGYRLTTNNRMELMACIVALRELKHRDKPVRLYTDSGYVVNGINKGWARNWRKRGWRKADNQPAVNPDLWGELLNLTADLDITFVWVKGHAGNPMNERCDELAVAAARRSGLPEDVGYTR